MNSLLSVTPIDGRYSEKTQILQQYFSEYAFFKYRLKIEIEYLIALSKTKINSNSDNTIVSMNSKELVFVRNIYDLFTVENCLEIKEIEIETKHDVKALEYYIKKKIKLLKDSTNTNNILSHVHFGLTSQDVNSSANILMIKNTNNDVLIPTLNILSNNLKYMVDKWEDIVMLSRTHGQPASPTKLGKELNVFLERLNKQLSSLISLEYTTKFGGAVGNFNSLVFSFKEVDWKTFSDNFTESLGLTRNQTTTQIDHYDNYSEIFDIIKRINVILIDMCRDIWSYISMEYFTIKIDDKSIGSSAMPHKINPILFENAEGNLLLANNLLQFFSSKLPISRLQRDLTDSTVLRNIGVAYSYTLIAYKSIIKGLSELDINEIKISDDLEINYEIIAEGIQTKLKTLGVENSYELMKEITRNTTKKYNKSINLDLNKVDFFLNLRTVIDSLNLNNDDVQELLNLTPETYTGV